jgi:Bardet-Biedl syndrome 7 protein
MFTIYKVEIDDRSLINVIKLLYPKLEYLRKLAENVKLIEPLKEIAMQDENLDYLDPGLKEILQNANEIQKEFKHQPRKLEFLYGIFTNLYLDKHKFKRTNVQQNVPKLLNLLKSNNCTLDKVISFFKQS